MTKLKNINLDDLGLKNKIINFSPHVKLEKAVSRKEMEFFNSQHSSFSENSQMEMMSKNYRNNSPTMNSKFSKHINFIESKDKLNQYFDKQAE